MLARLRREFVAITMALVGLVLVVALGSTLVTSVATQRALTRQVLEQALLGQVSPQIGVGGSQGADVALTITVDVSADGTSVVILSNTAVSIPKETLYDVIFEVLTSDATSGDARDYAISWMRAERGDGGFRIALVDTYTRYAALRSQAMSDLVIFAVSMGVLFVVVRLLAAWALRPVEEAWDRQRHFISDASHELKTPLAVILANTQILESERGLSEETRRWVRSTAEEAAHMRGLVEDLLTLARADEQAATRGGPTAGPVREDVDLTSLVDGCALEFDAVAFERGCSISCELADAVRVTGDPAQLGRVVRTLLDNATKYADRGSEVLVRLARAERRARLSVTNQGEPIAPEDLRHLFDRFYRTDRARARTGTGGFGLGLAIAKSVVEAHGGRIAATSTPEGRTTFTVTL